MLPSTTLKPYIACTKGRIFFDICKLAISTHFLTAIYSPVVASSYPEQWIDQIGFNPLRVAFSTFSSYTRDIFMVCYC